MNIKILGSGCKSCKTLESNVKEALHQLNMSADVEKVEDFKTIASYGVLQTPGLVVDEKMISSGKVLTVDKIKEMLQK